MKLLAVMILSAVGATGQLSPALKLTPTPICDVIRNPLEFADRTVAIEPFVEQWDGGRILRPGAGECGDTIDKRPHSLRALWLEFPSGEALRQASDTTRRFVEFFNEVSLHRASVLTVSSAVIGVIRVRKGVQPGTSQQGFGLNGAWPSKIELIKAWESR